MRKKLLVIHNLPWETIITNKLFNNDVSGWNRCITDWENRSYIKEWTLVTPDECENYDYVMLILLPEQNNDKLNRYRDIVYKPNRTYKVLVYLADVCGWQMNPFLPENKKRYMDILSGSDYVLRYNLPESEGYWKAVMRDKPSYYIERAFPIDEGKTLKGTHSTRADEVMTTYIKDRNKKYIFVGKSLKNINEERNVICSLYIAKEIQKQTGWGVICFANNPLPDDTRDALYKDICQLNDVIELPVLAWVDYMRVLTDLDIPIGIYLDCLETRGQVALDCACARIPLICSGSVAGWRLYPKTFIEFPRDINNALEAANKLISDEKYKNQVIEYAYKKVDHYSFANTRKQLSKILGDDTL